MDNYLDNLNSKQTNAVTATEGYVRVVAGAGSGKTKLLVSRYAYLVKEYGIDSSNILCVTFTNKAAGEMKRRIKALIGDAYDTSLICTYHGFCNRLLREDSEKLFMDKKFQIIDTYQQRAILGEIYQKYELKLDYASFDSILKAIETFKSYRTYIPKMCSPAPGQILDNIEDQTDQIIEDYLQKQKATYSLDFQDLILYAIYILVNNDDVKRKWQERLNYIMVDEFQDSSRVEMELIDILSDKYRNLMIVGDPDQNIYEWRGSDVKLLVDFDKSHDNTETVMLNQNYRSTEDILECSNELIKHNKNRLKKDLFTLDEERIPVIHYHSSNETDETERIVKTIKTIMHKEGMKYSDFAVLYRSGFLSRVIEKKFVEKNIPYEIYGGVRFYQRMEILDILAYLKLIAYGDDSSFRRIANVPRRRFGKNKMSYLEQLRDSSDISYQQDLFSLGETDNDNSGSSLLDTLRHHISNNTFSNSDISTLLNLVYELRAKKDTMHLSEIVNEAMSASGYERYIRELGDEERLENLSEFKRISNEFEKEFGEDLTLEQFLDQISLQSSENMEDQGDKVKLMTIHASKGLEFPCVFVVGLSEGIFPSSKTIEERKEIGLEEERRLCYVAMTRAQRYLFLMDSEGTSSQGMKKMYSRFLDEIGERNYTRVGKMSEKFKSESLAYRNKLNTQMTVSTRSDTKRIGDIVVHHIFGRGKIIAIDEKKNTYLVQFDSLDKTRNISAEYFEKPHIKPLIRHVKKDFSNEPKEVIEEKITEKEPVDIEELKKNTPNLLNDPNLPKTDWVCTGVTDLGAPAAVCQLCGKQIIRYVHHMNNPKYRSLDCGCVCAGKLEGNIEVARRREADFKKKGRKTFEVPENTGWKTSRNGNQYRRVNGHTLVLFKRKGKWMYTVDKSFNNFPYDTIEEAAKYAMLAVTTEEQDDTIICKESDMDKGYRDAEKYVKKYEQAMQILGNDKPDK